MEMKSILVWKFHLVHCMHTHTLNLFARKFIIRLRDDFLNYLDFREYYENDFTQFGQFYKQTGMEMEVS